MPANLLHDISQTFLPRPPAVLGVAVSGGGDSIALLHLLHVFATLHGTKLRAVTVDHGLRPEAAEEAKGVAKQCARLGILHETLTWTGWNGKGNLQNEARIARYAAMARWAKSAGISTIALGHTADDQAETVLMRLARRAGVDGLSGMRLRSHREGMTWVRPLLNITRERLRAYLIQENIPWIDDPSNEDTRFDRIKSREALSILKPLGIEIEGLAEVASHMAKCQHALDWQTFLAAKDIVTLDAGAVAIDECALRLLPEEIQRRLYIKAMQWISGSRYPPRRGAVASVMLALRDGQSGTVDGCHVRRVGGRVWVFRELNAVRKKRSRIDALWDDRWRVSPPFVNRNLTDCMVRVLGPEGLEQCPGWRACGRPHPVLLSTPAVWRGDTVVAAPLAGLDHSWKAVIEGGEDTFFAALLTH